MRNSIFQGLLQYYEDDVTSCLMDIASPAVLLLNIEDAYVPIIFIYLALAHVIASGFLNKFRLTIVSDYLYHRPMFCVYAELPSDPKSSGLVRT